MSVVIRTELAAAVPGAFVPVAQWGLLARVERPCPEHGGECPCVARDTDARCLVFWCERGEHHFSNR